MADRMSQDIKELKESLAVIAQKQDSQFQELRALAKKQDSQIQELKKLILLDSRTSPRPTTDSGPSAQLSFTEVDSDLKTGAEIPSFDESTEHEDHSAPNSTFIIENVPPSSQPPTWKYDVFVSFRGKDTRKGFVSHLFQAFKREDINCYRDVDRNERGQKVDSMLIDAIRQSKMAIILLSQNYADSNWCLQELVDILSWNEQNRIHGHMVLPIFYGVSSKDVKNLIGKVGEAYMRCIESHGDHKDIWKNAIKKVGTISSWTSNNGDEAYLIQEIVEAILERVAYLRAPFLLKSSIIPNDNMSHLRSMLDTTSNDVVRTFGICGLVGVGKTTLAHAACVHLHNEFEGLVILLEVNMETTTQHLLEIQNKIAEKLIKDKWLRLSEDTKKNDQEIRMRLSQMKVLIVLDNVTTLEQVEFVLGKRYDKYLGLGSRVVITSRDWGLLADQLKVDDVYMVPPLSHQDSLKLFCHYAFMGRQDGFNAIKEYEQLSKNIVHYAQGIPQVLENFGHSLSIATETEWHTKLDELQVGYTGDTQFGLFACCGKVESRWDDGEHTDVRGIELVIVDSVIKSIAVTYDNCGHPADPLFHGSPSSSLPKKIIKLDYPNEYLMAISGYCIKNEATGVTTVRSLTLHSNTRTHGPFGGDQSGKTGRPFSTKPTGAKIVGFFGAGDSQLQYIGVHVKQVSHTYPHPIGVAEAYHVHPLTTIGPFGDNFGCRWDDGKHSGVKRIEIDCGQIIYYMRFTYVDGNGVTIQGQEFGSRDINPPEMIEEVVIDLDPSKEYLVSISGWTMSESRTNYITSLSFETNLRKELGISEAWNKPAFYFKSNIAKIVGFHGTVGETGGLVAFSIGPHLQLL